MQLVRSFSVASAALVAFALAGQSRAAVLISEVYGGGDLTGSPYNQDFTELYNNTPLAVDIAGYQILYASTDVTTGFDVNYTFPAGSTLAGFGVAVVSNSSPGNRGAALPNGTAAGKASGFASSSGSVRLLDAGGTEVDLVGYGASARYFETARVTGMSNANSVQRTTAGLAVDTNNNSVDFFAAAPTPGVVPEPAGLAFLGLAGLAVARRRRA